MRVFAMLALAACGGAGGPDGVTPDGATSDGPTGCVLGITYTPTTPVAGVDPIIRAVAQVSGASAGAPTYTWVLLRNSVLMATPAPATPDNSEVTFSIDDALYTIAFSLAGEPQCLQANEVIDVNPQDLGTIAMRVHVVAPDPERPPLVKNVTVEGGAQDLLDSPIQLEPAITFDGHLESNGVDVAGYVRFMPGLGGEAAVETFANVMGDFQVKVRPETHDVLVIPSTPGVPPQIVTWQQQTTLTLGAGQTVTGVVNRPNGTPLPNATVQMSIGPPGASVPSTVGITNGTGAFSLRIMPQPGAITRIEVTAPASSGLPRLIAESTSFDPAMPVTVDYDAALTTQNLDGTIISRGGGLAGASVSIVGTIAVAGSITAGATQVANGEVRFSATTNGSGALPALLVPAAQLVAVIFPAGAVGDHAVTPVDLRTSVPIAINAALTVAKPTQLRESTNTTALHGAVLDAVPTGDLALAGAPTIRKTADDNGNLTIDLAPNGTYQLRVSDPNGNRAALAKSNATTATNITTLPLNKATRVQGLVLGQAAVSGAVVQLLCTGVLCQGLERSRPVAEGITGIDGRFSLAVPDPD